MDFYSKFEPSRATAIGERHVLLGDIPAILRFVGGTLKSDTTRVLYVGSPALPVCQDHNLWLCRVKMSTNIDQSLGKY